MTKIPGIFQAELVHPKRWHVKTLCGCTLDVYMDFRTGRSELTPCNGDFCLFSWRDAEDAIRDKLIELGWLKLLPAHVCGKPLLGGPVAHKQA